MVSKEIFKRDLRINTAESWDERDLQVVGVVRTFPSNPRRVYPNY